MSHLSKWLFLCSDVSKKSPSRVETLMILESFRELLKLKNANTA
jgi:hypothetical protein